MAGHSKWANIKHKKEKADKQKGKIFSRIAKEIISAVKQKGNDPKSNAKLRLAIQKAKDNNVPNDVIDRNIKKASNKDQKEYFELLYEVYGHNGVGIILEIMTDNRNRIASEINIVINKLGGSVAQSGAVLFNFEKKGVVKVLKKDISEDDLFLLVSDLGALDLVEEGDFYVVTTKPEELFFVKKGVEAKKIVVESASLEMVAKNLVSCDADVMNKNVKLIEGFEGIEDVDSLFHNMRVEF